MKVGSLFSGIGGFDLAAERAGFEIAWQVEIDDYATKVLEKHWPHVQRFRDVKECGVQNLPAVDIICGGFPCQDISEAGERAGIDGERSGLWRDMARIISELRPRYVVVENVAALLVRGMGRVLGDLAALGYDAEWDCLPAAAVGSRQLRDRVFIVATSRSVDGPNRVSTRGHCGLGAVERWMQNHPIGRCFDGSPWAAEPAVDRVAYGVPKGLDRCCACGNAIVPQVAEWIFRQIAEADAAMRESV